MPDGLAALVSIVALLAAAAGNCALVRAHRQRLAAALARQPARPMAAAMAGAALSPRRTAARRLGGLQPLAPAVARALAA